MHACACICAYLPVVRDCHIERLTQAVQPDGERQVALGSHLIAHAEALVAKAQRERPTKVERLEVVHDGLVELSIVGGT